MKLKSSEHLELYLSAMRKASSISMLIVCEWKWILSSLPNQMVGP